MLEFSLVALAGILVALALFCLRSVTHGHEMLTWTSGWVALIAAAIVSDLPDASDATFSLGQLFGLLFPALLFAGAMAFRRGHVPWWALGIPFGVGALEAGLAVADLHDTSILLSVPIKVAFIVGAARILWPPSRAAVPGVAEWLLGPLLLVLAIVAGVGPLVRTGLVPLDPTAMRLIWVVVGFGVGTLQLGTILGRHQQLEQQRCDQTERLARSEDRNQKIEDALAALRNQRREPSAKREAEERFLRMGDSLTESLKQLGLVLETLGFSTAKVGTPAPDDALLNELHGLTPREGEIVRSLLAGYRVPTIAQQAFISPHTVRNHLKSVFRKLGVQSQAELISKLRRQRAGENPEETVIRAE